MNGLPPVSDDQIQQMNKLAEKNYGSQVNQEMVQEPEPIAASEQEEQSVVEEPTAAEPQESTDVQEPKTDTSKDSRESFREIRERALRAERDKEQLMRFITERIPQQQQQQHAQPSQPQEEDLNFSIAPDELAEGKHLAKLNKKIDRLEKRLEQGAQQSSAMSIEAQLKANYPDIQKVLSESNIASLSELYPEIAKTIGNSKSDMYSQAVSAYTMIKKLGIHQDDAFVQEKAKVQANSAKPRPLASLSPQQGESPLSKANAFANGLTPELQKQLWKETKEAMKNG